MESIYIIKIIITMLSIGLIIAFLYLINWIKERKIKISMNSFALENGSLITNYERSGHTILGLDASDRKKLFFIKKIDKEKIRLAINLAEIKKCAIEKETSLVDEIGKKTVVIEKIELVLSYSDLEKAPVRLELYNTDHNHFTLTGELQVAERWHQLINETISSVIIRKIGKETKRPSVKSRSEKNTVNLRLPGVLTGKKNRYASI